jgi:DNA repair protein RadC
MEVKPHYLEHRKRLRERFSKSGGEGLNDYELLELLLTFALPRVDVKPVAKGLLKRFGGVSGVLDASSIKLEAADGLGPTSATLIRVVKELLALYLKEQLQNRDALSSPDAVVNYSRSKLAGLPHEAFMVLYLNVKNEVIEDEILHEGTVDHAVVYPRRVVESALAHHASCIILVHNHPSGHPEPSSEDKLLTRSIVEAAKTVDIRVLDHVIVGRRGHFSFQQNRMLSDART